MPLIYHLDVAAMYPNIILTNRLQPSSIVTGGRTPGAGGGPSAAAAEARKEWLSCLHIQP